MTLPPAETKGKNLSRCCYRQWGKIIRRVYQSAGKFCVLTSQAQNNSFRDSYLGDCAPRCKVGGEKVYEIGLAVLSVVMKEESGA